MYPGALNKIPLETIDSSQVFNRWILQKQQKIINKITKTWDKNTIENLELVCPKQYHDCFSWLLSSKTILLRILIYSRSLICLVRSICHYWILNKKLRKSERFNFVDTDNTLHNTNFTALNSALSTYQTILPCTLHSEVWSCVWMGN